MLDTQMNQMLSTPFWEFLVIDFDSEDKFKEFYELSTPFWEFHSNQPFFLNNPKGGDNFLLPFGSFLGSMVF